MVKILAVSVLVALSIGCAKSSDSNPASGAAPAPAPAGPTPPAKEDGKGPGNPADPQAPSQQEEEEEGGDDVGPGDQIVDQDQQDQDEDDLVDEEEQPPQPMKPAPLKPKPVIPVIPQKPAGPGAVNEANIMAVKAFLADSMRKASPAIRDRNLKAARQISYLEFISIDLTKELRVLVGLEGSKKPVALGGIREKGKAELFAQGGPNFAPVIKGAEMKGLLLCLDYQFKGLCYTSLLRLEFGVAGKRATVFAISRKTNAGLSLEQLSENLNPAANKLVALFENTKQVAEQRRRQGIRSSSICKSGVKNVIRSSLVESYDVINGGSNVNLSLLTCEREVIVLNSPFMLPGNLAAVKQTPIPLAAFQTPRFGSLINIFRNMARDREIQADPTTINEKTSGAKFNIQRAIAEGKLTRFNEANGVLSVSLRLKSASQKSSAVQMSFRRLTHPIASVRGVESLLRSNPVR